MKLPGPMTSDDFAAALQAARAGFVVSDSGADEELDAALLRVADSVARTRERVASVRAAKDLFASR